MTNNDGLESFEARPTQAEIDERDRPQLNAVRVFGWMARRSTAQAQADRYVADLAADEYKARRARKAGRGLR